MKIAIVDDNKTYQEVLELKVEKHNIGAPEKWEVDFFVSCNEFGKASLKGYAIIIAEYHLPVMKGSQLLESLKNKTNASLALMGIKNGWVSEQIVKNDAIKTIIDKSDPNNVIEWIEHMESRMKFNGYYEKISVSYEACATHLSALSKDA